MSLYKDYLKEREDMEVYENEHGFVSYCYLEQDQALYLAEIYVVPKKRNTPAGYRLYQRVVNIAKANGYSKIMGSVDVTTNGYELSEKLMGKLGFRFYKKVGYLIYFIKTIQD